MIAIVAAASSRRVLPGIYAAALGGFTWNTIRKVLTFPQTARFT
jgi:hypothetical protein